MGTQLDRRGPLVAITNVAIVFVPKTTRPSSDPALRRDFLHVGERLARGPGSAADVALEAAASADVIPVDGCGRSLPGALTSDGLLGPDLWLRFADTLPVLAPAPDAGPRSRPAPVLRFAPQFFDARTRTVWAYVAMDGFVPDIVGALATPEPTPGDRCFALGWPTLGHLFPSPAASLEAAEAQARLRTVLRLQEQGDSRAALAQAETALAQRRSEVTIPSLLDFWEIARRHRGDAAVLFEAEGQFGIAAASWASLCGDRRFRAAVDLPTVVPYLHGFVGYLWSQAVQALRAGMVPRSCAHCGGRLPLTATARRRYCTKAESPGCGRERHARRMRDRRGGPRAP